MTAIPLGACAPLSVQNPLTDRLLNQIPDIKRFLRRRGFSDFVAEKAVDRVIQAALPYLTGDANPEHIRDWHKWVFGSAYVMARWEASREPRCYFMASDFFTARMDAEEDEELRQEIQLALGKLADRQRQAVELCVMLERSPTEAAKEMKCSRSTVEHHLKRGLHLLREILSDSTRIRSTKLASYRQRE
jgi:RNA polymerase sigma factor (sigma-70 family)